MSDQSIFGETNSAPASQPSQTNQLDTMLDMIRNDKGERKYKDVTEALNALAHSQAYIPQIKQELEATRSQLTAAQQEANKIAQLEETLARLTTPQAPAQTPTAQVNEDVIAELVNRTLTKSQQDSARQANLASVVTKLQEAFGNEAEKQFYEKAKALGMTPQEVNELASKSPVAVLNLMGVSAAKQAPTSNSPSFNTQAFQPTADSLIGKNKAGVLVGATTSDVRAEFHNAAKMVDELHSSGRTINDLTKPSEYFKFFK